MGFRDKILTREEIELNYVSIKNEIESIQREYPLWWISFDKAYLFADLVAEELWKRYGERSIGILIERLRKYNEPVKVIDKIAIYKALDRYKAFLSNI